MAHDGRFEQVASLEEFPADYNSNKICFLHHCLRIDRQESHVILGQGQLQMLCNACVLAVAGIMSSSVDTSWQPLHLISCTLASRVVCHLVHVCNIPEDTLTASLRTRLPAEPGSRVNDFTTTLLSYSSRSCIHLSTKRRINFRFLELQRR